MILIHSFLALKCVFWNSYNKFLAVKEVEIIQNELKQNKISTEAGFWFGTTWDSDKNEYISDNGKKHIQ